MLKTIMLASALDSRHHDTGGGKGMHKKAVYWL